MHLLCPHCHATNRLSPERARAEPRCGRCHAELLPARPIELDDDHLEPLVKTSGLPVLVDVWAPWCGPCQAFAPHFEAAARQLQGRVICAKLDSDQNPRSSVRLRIRSIPTLLLMEGGEEIARVSGAMAAPELMRWLGRHLPRPSVSV